MSDVKLNVAQKAAVKAAHKALAEVVGGEKAQNGKYANAARALNVLSVALGDKRPWFDTVTANLTGPVREEYEAFKASCIESGITHEMPWKRVRDSAPVVLAEDLAANANHPWASYAQKVQEAVKAAEAKKVAEAARKRAASEKNAAARAAVKALPTAPIVASAASVQETGPVDTAPAIAARAAVVNKLPADERLTLEVCEKLDELLAMFKSAPESVSFPAFVDAGILVGKASKLLATKREQAKAHASRLKNGGAQ